MYPVLFKIGSFPVHSYGVVLIIAFLVALVVARKRAPRFGIDRNKLTDMAFLALIAGVLGARIAYFIQDPPKDWHEYFSLQFAGLTSFGGLVGGALVVIWWSWKTKTSVRLLLDVMGPPLLVGQAIGRIGCLLNGCCYGVVCPASFPFGIHTSENPYLHYPAQLYDSLMTMAAFCVLLFIEKMHRFKSGQVAALAIGFWGLSRIIDEFSRAGTEAQVSSGRASSTYWGTLPFTQAQVAAGVLIAISVVMYIAFSKQRALEKPLPRSSDQDPPSRPTPVEGQTGAQP
ncbi:MAG: prolipoprotein diacylglyceryl transferase [Fimbriimonadales bacterium]